MKQRSSLEGPKGLSLGHVDIETPKTFRCSAQPTSLSGQGDPKGGDDKTTERQSDLRERDVDARSLPGYQRRGSCCTAVTHLPKNSVGSKQLRKNAVTTPKVKKEAITAAKVKKGTLTGTQINSLTLGTVPAARTAQTATTLAAPEAWHEVGAPGEPAFQFGWHNVPSFESETVAFYKDGERSTSGAWRLKV